VSADLSIEYGADEVLDITLRRAAEGNVLTHAMGDDIIAALAGLREGTKAVVVAAEGADFCIGRQTPMPAGDAKPTASDLRRIVSDPVLDFYTALRSVKVPVIAAVRGRARGVGCALVALADLAIAAEDATFQVPEMSRDIAPTLVMTALADRLPRAAQARLVLSRDAIGAAEALAVGLVGMVVPTAGLDAEVSRVRAGLAANTVPVLRAVKGFLAMAPEMSYAARRDYAAFANATAASDRYRA
jgi:enoyl-CoA hydratase/carnithine racemase